MDKRLMELFDYNACLAQVDKLLLEYERISYKMLNIKNTPKNIIINKQGNTNNNQILNQIIKKMDNEDDYSYIYHKLESIYLTFCDIEKEYFNNCLLHRLITDEEFSEKFNISIMHMRKVKKSVVFKITEGFNISIMKGE